MKWEKKFYERTLVDCCYCCSLNKVTGQNFGVHFSSILHSLPYSAQSCKQSDNNQFDESEYLGCTVAQHRKYMTAQEIHSLQGQNKGYTVTETVAIHADKNISKLQLQNPNQPSFFSFTFLAHRILSNREIRAVEM